jgi:2-hydroxychromene-2-carboxylate isomerase
MSSPRSPIRFYFDYISSNAYLAWVALPKLAEKYGAEIDPVAVLFAGLLEAHGQLGPAEIPAKSFWMWKNNMRKATLLGVPLNPPAYHPFNPLLALRVSSLPMAAGERARLVDGLFKAVWVEQLHVSEPAVVVTVADAAGLNGERLVAEAQQPESKARLRARTDQAIAEGVFGVPTMIFGDELFWGYDDLPYLELLLAGRDPLSRADLPNVAPRPSAARRRFRTK